MAEDSVRPLTSPAKPADAPRVLLVDPYIAREDPMERKFVELYPSLGLLTLAAYLQEQGSRVEIVDLTLRRGVGRFEDRLRTFRPTIVGVHTKTLTSDRAMQLAQISREAGVPCVAGGPDAATRPEAYLDGGYNVVVWGEGEATLADLARRLDEGRSIVGTPGTIVRAGGRDVRGSSRPFLRDLDALPLPAWELIDMEAYLRHWERRTGERRAAVLTSRGCPFDCSWCSKPTFGRSFRQQSPERVLAEVRALVDRYRVDYVRFCDDVFGIHRPWLETLLNQMLAEGPRVQFECLARVDLLKPDLLAKMRRAGLARVYVGVESGSQKMLDLMNRGTRLAQVERAAESLRREGIRQFWFLMLGYPGETLDDIEATLQLFRRFSPEEYSVSIAVPVPGTRFYESVKDRLTGRGRATGRRGGTTLLYEAAYPEAVYRWEQARFGLDAALGRARGKISDEVLGALASAADRFHSRVATPLLTGGPKPPVAERPAPRPPLNLIARVRRRGGSTG